MLRAEGGEPRVGSEPRTGRGVATVGLDPRTARLGRQRPPAGRRPRGPPGPPENPLEMAARADAPPAAARLRRRRALRTGRASLRPRRPGSDLLPRRVRGTGRRRPVRPVRHGRRRHGGLRDGAPGARRHPAVRPAARPGAHPARAPVAGGRRAGRPACGRGGTVGSQPAGRFPCGDRDVAPPGRPGGRTVGVPVVGSGGVVGDGGFEGHSRGGPTGDVPGRRRTRRAVRVGGDRRRAARGGPAVAGGGAARLAGGRGPGARRLRALPDGVQRDVGGPAL